MFSNKWTSHKQYLLKLLTSFISIIIFSGSLSYSQSISKNSEIYDYSIGDEFHYSLHSMVHNKTDTIIGGIEYLRTVVLDKWHDSSGDTVFYIMGNSNYFIHEGQYVLGYSEEVIDYTELDSTLDNIDSTYSDPNVYNGRKINHQQDSSGVLNHDYKYNYIEGCGEVYYIYQPGSETEIKLVYFKKKAEEWGNKLSVGIDDFSDKPKIQVFPNPTSGPITIDLNKDYMNVDIQLTNIKGQLINTWSLDNVSQIMIDIPRPSGIYLLHIKLGSEYLVYKLLKE